MEIRAEKPDDIAAIRQVNRDAFGQDDEANLVDYLRSAASTLSVVAVKSDHETEHIVGHIFYSPVEVEGYYDQVGLILGLAPVAVLPAYQRQGIGSMLIQHSLKRCAELGSIAVVVLGHPEYYPRFGFIPAKQRGLRCEYTVPDETFMVLELQRDALKGCRGTVKYRPEFNTLT